MTASSSYSLSPDDTTTVFEYFMAFWSNNIFQTHLVFSLPKKLESATSLVKKYNVQFFPLYNISLNVQRFGFFVLFCFVF